MPWRHIGAVTETRVRDTTVAVHVGGGLVKTWPRPVRGQSGGRCTDPAETIRSSPATRCGPQPSRQPGRAQRTGTHCSANLVVAESILDRLVNTAFHLAMEQPSNGRWTCHCLTVSALMSSLTWGLLAGGSLLVGALAAARVRLSARLAALLTAFGGGVLLAAVATELIPEADERAGKAWAASGLLAGAMLYVAADAFLTRDETTRTVRRSGHAAAAGQDMTMAPNEASAARGQAIAAGIVVDGVPESLALGLMAAERSGGLALLIAVVIGNVTEAYGAAQPILAGGRSRRYAIGLLSGIGLILAAATVVGGTVGTSVSPVVIGTLQALAAGAVLAVLTISVVPYAFREANSGAAVATTLGFTLGYLLS